MRDEKVGAESIDDASELKFLHQLSTPFTVVIMSVDKGQEFLTAQSEPDPAVVNQLQIAMQALETIKHLLGDRRKALIALESQPKP
jgi:hypothetical protein